MPPEHTPVVLLVEGQPFVRMSTADALIDSGFAVVEAQDAEEALNVVAGCSRVDLLFTDVDLGTGLDGLELSRLVDQRSPQTKLVVTSGHVRLRNEDLPDAGVFVAKPYRTEQLCDIFRAQLAG